MADEFAKGLGILSTAGLIWLSLAGNYRTESFAGQQLTAPVPEELTAFQEVAVVVMDSMFWFMVLGTLLFWLVIPAGRAGRDYLAERAE